MLKSDCWFKTFDDRPDIKAFFKYICPSMSIVKKINQGGSGVIYELSDDRYILKVTDTGHSGVFGTDRAANTFYAQSEIFAMETLFDCPHTLSAYKTAVFKDPEDENRIITIIIMPKLIPLTDYLEKNQIKKTDVLQIGRDISRALCACHKAGYAHRDVNVSNIFIEKLPDEKMRFILGDFSVSCKPSDYPPKWDNYIGKRGFIDEQYIRSPKQLFSSDIYSLGATLYCILCGRTYQKDIMNSLSDDSLSRIIKKACAPTSDKKSHCFKKSLWRYENICELSDDLENCEIKYDRVISEGFLVSAKMAYINGNIPLCDSILKKGQANLLDGCVRFKAYRQYCLNESSNNLSDSKNALSILANQNDPIAQMILGIIYHKESDSNNSEMFLEKSAQNGCNEGRYLYGRILWEKYRNRSGIDYIIQAAENANISSLRFLGKYGKVIFDKLTYDWQEKVKDGSLDKYANLSNKDLQHQCIMML